MERITLDWLKHILCLISYVALHARMRYYVKLESLFDECPFQPCSLFRTTGALSADYDLCVGPHGPAN